jgi:transposase
VFDHGDLRFILLSMIAAKPAHGYDLIKALEDRMGGGYSPSPGERIAGILTRSISQAGGHSPQARRSIDEAKQKAFIKAYDKLLNSLGSDEVVRFADAVHPTDAARPFGCWAPKADNLAIEQTSGRDRINIHGAINLESGQTRMIDVQTVDAASTIALLAALEAFYPLMMLIHVFLDNARYHHAKLVQEWLARPDCRIRLHFIPSYCPHLNPIERLWGVMHRNVTPNKCYPTVAQFADATLRFLREKVPRNWPQCVIRSPTTSASSDPAIFGS